MKFLSIFTIILTISIVLAFNLPGQGNGTLQQELLQEENEAGSYARISNGKLAPTNQFAYQVGMTVARLGARIWCGGSLINSEWVLTAAHCTIDALAVFIYLGSKKRGEYTVMHDVARANIKNHPDFNRASLHNDISLIKIPEVISSHTIKRVRLPTSGGYYPSYVFTTAVFSGWGRTSGSANSLSRTLQYAKFTVISNNECTRYYGPAAVFKENMCTRDLNKVNSGVGDGGGPLVMQRRNIQIGILSFGGVIGKSLPEVFTRVDSYLDWISKTTGMRV